MAKKAPDPTPPKETSAAQTSTSVATAIANAFLQNPTEIGPDGSTSVDQTGSTRIYDPYTEKSYDIPQFTRTTRLSDAQQRIKDQQDAAKFNISNLAQNQSAFLNEYTSKPFSYDPGQHESWAMGLYDQLNSDRNDQQDEALRSRLANQGIKAGSEAYDREMRSRTRGVEDARNEFLLDSYQTGFGTAQSTRNQPINEITALLSGSQVSQPQFMGAKLGPIPTTDNAGIISNYDNQRIQLAQMDNAFAQNVFGGLFGLGAGILSDERAKKDIKPVGEMGGHRLYSYHYKGEPKNAPKSVGVMAQEVEKTRPDAVTMGPDGLRRVKYGQLFGMAA